MEILRLQLDYCLQDLTASDFHHLPDLLSFRRLPSRDQTRITSTLRQLIILYRELPHTTLNTMSSCIGETLLAALHHMHVGKLRKFKIIWQIKSLHLFHSFTSPISLWQNFTSCARDDGAVNNRRSHYVSTVCGTIGMGNNSSQALCGNPSPFKKFSCQGLAQQALL